MIRYRVTGTLVIFAMQLRKHWIRFRVIDTLMISIAREALLQGSAKMVSECLCVINSYQSEIMRCDINAMQIKVMKVNFLTLASC